VFSFAFSSDRAPYKSQIVDVDVYYIVSGMNSLTNSVTHDVFVGKTVRSMLFVHSDGSRWGRVLPPFVCLFSRMISQKTMINKPDIQHDIQMFHYQSWKPNYFGFKRRKVKVISYGLGLCTLVNAGFFCDDKITMISRR